MNVRFRPIDWRSPGEFSHDVERPPQQWLVQTSSGELRIMTLDELDDAYQHGRIDERTLILSEDTAKWVTLAELAGIAVSE